MRGACLAVSLLAFPSAALAAPRYPLRASVRFESGEDCVKAEETVCQLASGVPAAFSGAATRLFSISAAPVDLDLSVRVTGIEAIATVGGPQLVMRVRVTLSAADRPLGAIEVAGEGPFLESTAPSLQAAAERATLRAAQEFVDVFPEGSPELVQWLAQRQLANPSDYVRPVRAPSRFAASAGGGGVEGGDGEMVPGVSLEARQTIQWFTVALNASSSSPHFLAAAPGSLNQRPANLTAWDFGLEPGVSFPLLPNLDLRAGPGLHLFVGNASLDTNSQSISKVGLDAWCGLSLAVLPSHRGSRVLFSLLGKVYFATSVDLPQLSRRIPIVDNAFLLTVGYEWNVGGAR